MRLAVRLESVVVLVLLCALMAILTPYFLSVGNFINILLATSVIGVLAVAATFVLCSGALDLSIGSLLAFTAVVTAVFATNGIPWYLSLLAGLVAGGLLGAVNGWLSARAGIPAFIVTLGMLSAARGATLLLSDGRAIYGLPDAIRFIGQGRLFGIPMPVIVFLGVVVIAHFVLSYTRFGTTTLVLGDNEMAARVTGTNVEAHRIRLFVLSGVLAGVAGLLFMARINAADPTAGVGSELAAITAAVIGGTNLFGGRGTVAGTLIGALVMGVLQNGLNLLAVAPFYQQISIGVILILAVWLDRARAKVRR